MLPAGMAYDPLFVDIYIGPIGNIFVLSQNGLIYEFDSEEISSSFWWFGQWSASDRVSSAVPAVLRSIPKVRFCGRSGAS